MHDLALKNPPRREDSVQERTVVVEDHKADSDDLLVVFAREEDWYHVVDRDGANPTTSSEGSEGEQDEEEVEGATPAPTSTTGILDTADKIIKAKRRNSSPPKSTDDDEWVMVDRQMLSSAVNDFVSQLVIDNPKLLGMRQEQLSKLIHGCVSQSSWKGKAAAGLAPPSTSSFSSLYWPAIRMAYRAYEMYRGPGQWGWKLVSHPVFRSSLSSALQCVLFFVTPA